MSQPYRPGSEHLRDRFAAYRGGSAKWAAKIKRDGHGEWLVGRVVVVVAVAAVVAIVVVVVVVMVVVQV